MKFYSTLFFFFFGQSFKGILGPKRLRTNLYINYILQFWVSQVVLLVMNPAYQCRRLKRLRFNPWVGKIPWKKAWKLTPVFLPGESHGPRRLTGGLQSIGSQRVGHN